MGDHLHQMSAGSSAPPASSSAKASASVNSCAEPAANEMSSPGACLLLGNVCGININICDLMLICVY